ncbi:MAG: hypothetical protein HUJ93_04690 [Bacteroidales bacterium]|nr:hypothetical protein [Bacteroidales bacterium]
MKKIFRYLIPCIAMSFVLTSCYDVMGTKAEIDEQYKVATPTVTLSSASALDYQTIQAVVSTGDASLVQEMGMIVAKKMDFSDAVYVAVEPNASATVTKNGFADLTKYYVKGYVFSKNGETITSEAVKVTTPEVKFTSDMLTGKKYTGSTIDYWGDAYNFNVYITLDENDPDVVYICDLEPYFASNDFTAAKGYNRIKGVIDYDKMVINIENGQGIGYSDVAFYAWSDDEDHITIDIINKGAQLKVHAFWLADGDGGAWAAYADDILLTAK